MMSVCDADDFVMINSDRYEITVNDEWDYVDVECFLIKFVETTKKIDDSKWVIDDVKRSRDFFVNVLSERYLPSTLNKI